MKREEEKDNMQDGIFITEKSTAHMVAQIRSRQLATKSSQDSLQKAILIRLSELQDVSGEELIQSILANLFNWQELILNTNVALKQTSVESIGYPIKFNKTLLQLEMVSKWVESKGVDLIGDLEKAILYNNLSNDSGIDKLPLLQSDNMSNFWGNENSSVSTVLLYSVAKTVNIEVDYNSLAGAATFYPFFSDNFYLDIASNQNPFVFQNGMVLFGDYQFGAHRYFSNEPPGLGQRLFSPEDCSTAVGKATGLSERQIVGINTTLLRGVYGQENEYGYKSVTSSLTDKLELGKIKPGDIYVRGGHTAIVSALGEEGSIKTLEFNRDIDIEVGKRLGGGSYQYDLIELSKTEPPIYILRSSLKPLKESCSLPELVGGVDSKYGDIFSDTPIDVVGDCSIFICEDFFA